MPKPDSSASAVVVSGGKQYRVAPGDRILVDRLEADPGSSIKIARVLLFTDGTETKLGKELEGLDVEAKVVGHRRGPRTESLRYKSKKRVRVHRGGRAHLTDLEIIAVGGIGLEQPETEEAEETPKPRRGRAKAAPKKKAAPKAEVEVAAVEETAEEQPEPAKKTSRRRTKKEETE